MIADFIARILGMVILAALGVYWGINLGGSMDKRSCTRSLGLVRAILPGVRIISPHGRFGVRVLLAFSAQTL
jgi:hypothetical protein